MNASVAAYLDVYGLLVAVVRPAMVGALLLGLWLGLGRAGVTSRSKTTLWFAVAVPLVLWLAGIWNLAEAGGFQGARSPLPIAIVVPVIVGLIAVTRSRRIAAAVDAVPTSWLIGLQVYRVLGGTFVILWLLGAVPGVFAVPAGFGDVLVGLLAIPVALYVASGRRGGTAVAVAWNILGLVDLVDALILGFLSSPGPLQHLAHDHPNLLITAYPTVMTPAFAVPLSIILHGVSLWQLGRRSRAARQRSVVWRVPRTSTSGRRSTPSSSPPRS